MDLFLEEAFLENDQDGHPDRNGGVGDVENGPEKDEFVATPEGEPLWIEALDDREIEHVHHFAMEEGAVAPLRRHEPRHLVKGAFTEDYAVKCTVDDVSQGASQYERDAEHKTERLLAAGDPHQVPADGHHCQYPEDAQCDLAEFAAELHAEGHAFIFGKVEDEPVAKDSDFPAGPNEHARFDPDFQDLIRDQNEYNNEYGTLQIIRN